MINSLSPIFQLINADNTICINRNIARAIGINAAIVFSALISKHTYYSKQDRLTPDGFFYSTISDLEQSTTLSRKQQDAALTVLREQGLIETALMGTPPKRFFKIVNNVERISALLEDNPQFVQKGQINLSERDKSNCPKGTNQIVQKGQIKLSEMDKSNCPKGTNSTFYNHKLINHKLSNQSINQSDRLIDRGSDNKKGEDIEKEGDINAVREKYGYEYLVHRHGYDIANSYIQIIADVMETKSHHIRINGEDMSANRVKRVYEQITPAHIDYVISNMENEENEIRNIRAYIRTSLYNAVSTMDIQYSVGIGL